MPAAPFADFPLTESNAHRELAGQLSVPRTVAGVERTLADLAPHYRYPNGKDAAAILKGLEKAGLVKKLGKHEDATAAVEAIKADGDTVDIPKEKADRYIEVSESWKDTPRLATDDELWILTKDGLDALTTSPESLEDPPLTGARLEQARLEDEEWWENQREIEEQGRAEEIERLQKRIDDIKKEGDK